MRIISKFKDYYDGVMRTGMDREVVYVRENKEIELKEDFGFDFSTSESGNLYEVKLLLLGYCGQIYKVMDLTYQVKSKVLTNVYDKYRKVFFDYEEFKKFMTERGLCRQWDFESSYWGGKFHKFNKFVPFKLLELFHRYQTPLFLVSHKTKYSTKGITTVTLGPNLQKLYFHRVKDAYTAYQDIFQFVAGVLNHPETKMVKISDEDKIAKHGYDKWSFRQKGPKK